MRGARALTAGVVCALAVTMAPSQAVAAGPGPAASSVAPARSSQAGERARPAVVERRVIGHSRRGRAIIAWRVGDPEAKRKVVLLSTMHGNEPHTRQILYALRDGRPIRGVDMWLVPVLNPDGLKRRVRKNAAGVDLNRNYPYAWKRLSGSYYSGKKPASEPETRALMKFLRRVEPDRLVSFHQPLHGVDTDTKKPGFARRLARKLGLPRKAFVCGGVCHGTMTGWYNHNFDGAAITVEYGARPATKTLRGKAARGLLRAVGARRVAR
ncbi:M14 family zinc carboxypeptidase [Nocardioides sp. Bht2]|uniref:M14 family zinc carboxypeptidase n=1 Tax=Nocardioides sp. Bht2 TaxID=3392297 RepID=UPI0039B3CE68